MAREPLEKVERAVRDAVRDVAALWYLFQVVNITIATERRLLWAHMELLAHTVFGWLRDEFGAPERAAERVRSCVREVVVWHAVVETISRERFQGYDVLLSEPRQELDDLRRFAEDLLVRFNDQLDFFVWRKKERRKRGPKLPPPIDWETVHAEMQDEIATRVSTVVDVGRAEACDMMGETRRAQAFRERHL